MIKTRKEYPEGSHEHDVQVTSDLLKEVRRMGLVIIPNTVDGEISVLYTKKSRHYVIHQTYEGQTVSNVDVSRRFTQQYLIELREKRRAEEKKARRGKKDQ